MIKGVVFCKDIIYKTMSTIKKHDERIAQMKFPSVYPHYVTKVEKKGRTKEELRQVIEWLTGYDVNKVKKLILTEMN